MHSDLKHIFDGAALTSALATFVGLLPAIAAALSIIWTVIRIIETKTFQDFLARFRK